MNTMPRLLPFVATLLAVLAQPVAGQPAPDPSPAASPSAPQAEPPALNSLRTPTSPAFTLLGIEPTSVERPNTPADVAVSLAESTSGFSTLPKNYALEFSPYWLARHPRLTWNDDADRTLVDSIRRTLTLSVATAQSGTDGAPVTSLAVGGRVSLFSGKVPEDQRTRLRELQAMIAKEAELFQKQLEAAGIAPVEAKLRSDLDAIDEQARLAKLDAPQAEQKKRDLAKAFAAKQDEIARAAVEAAAYKGHQLRAQVRKAVDAIGSNREGFSWEVAGGASWDVPGNDWDRRQARNVGVWTTLAYTGRAWSLVGVGRYLEDRVVHSHSYDLGARAIYSRDDYAVSLEYLHRSASGEESGNRFVGLGEYKLADKAWLLASFGRDQNASGGRTLVAKLGLSFNLAKQRYQDL